MRNSLRKTRKSGSIEPADKATPTAITAAMNCDAIYATS